MKSRLRRLSFNSIRMKLLIGIVSILLSLIVLMIVNNYYAINVVRNQVAKSNQNMMSLYMGQIDKSLADVDAYMLALMLSNYDLKMIGSSNTKDEILLSKIKLQDTLSSTILVNKTIDSFFIYSPLLDDMTEAFKQVSTYKERELIRAFIRDKLAPGAGFYEDHASHWFVQQIGEQNYMLRVMKTGSIYIGAWVKAATLQLPLADINFGEDGAALLIDDDGKPLIETPLIERNKIDLSRGLDEAYKSGSGDDYLIVGHHSAIGNISLAAVIPEAVIVENLPAWIRFAFLSLAGCVLLLPGFFLFLRKTVMKPLYHMISAMRKFGGGDVKVRLKSSAVADEFLILNDAFNHMANQIEALKINVYEEKLSKQKAELQHLQLQINPHFFMNALNIIYTFARSNKVGLIQELVMCLVRYFRYMFSSNLKFISFKDELEHVKNYLRIQEIRYPNTLRCDIDVPEMLQDVKVPPLVIHTFVENTVKHEVSLNDPVRIRIEAELDESESDAYVAITIRDTGKGFAPEVLEELRKGNRIVDEQGEHIGIWNVMHRLRLLYENKADISFANEDGAGARITMRLPIDHPEESAEDEHPGRRR